MSTMNKSLTVAELMATIGQVAEGASDKKALLDTLQQIGQAATDIVELLERKCDEPGGAKEGAAVADALVKALTKAIGALRIPTPQVTVNPAIGGNDWKSIEVEVLAWSVSGAPSKYQITRK